MHASRDRISHQMYMYFLCQAATSLKRARTITLEMGGLSLNIVVKDPTTEWELRLFAWLKDRAIMSGVIPRMPFEDWLCKPVDKCLAIKMEQCILKDMVSCRNLAIDMMSQHSLENMDDLKKASPLYVSSGSKTLNYFSSREHACIKFELLKCQINCQPCLHNVANDVGFMIFLCVRFSRRAGPRC